MLTPRLHQLAPQDLACVFDSIDPLLPTPEEAPPLTRLLPLGNPFFNSFVFGGPLKVSR